MALAMPAVDYEQVMKSEAKGDGNTEPVGMCERTPCRDEQNQKSIGDTFAQVVDAEVLPRGVSGVP